MMAIPREQTNESFVTAPFSDGDAFALRCRLRRIGRAPKSSAELS